MLFGRAHSNTGLWPASAGAYATVDSDSTKLSVKAIGEMLDWMRESECFASRNLATTGTRTEGNVIQIA